MGTLAATAPDWIAAWGGVLGGLGSIAAACVAIVAIIHQARSARGALRAQFEATQQAFAHERALVQDERLWQRRADLYGQLLGITALHPESYSHIVGDITVLGDPMPVVRPKYQEALALAPHVEAVGSRAVTAALGTWTEHVRELFDHSVQTDRGRQVLFAVTAAQERLVSTIRTELGADRSTPTAGR
jgi:hypothetical protein